MVCFFFFFFFTHALFQVSLGLKGFLSAGWLLSDANLQCLTLQSHQGHPC